MTGHGWDVKCLAWHPTKGLLASGSKDNLTKLWDPSSGKCLATLHGHKNTVMAMEWNANGNYLLTACRDSLVRVYDIRTMKEMQVLLELIRGLSRSRKRSTICSLASCPSTIVCKWWMGGRYAILASWVSGNLID